MEDFYTYIHKTAMVQYAKWHPYDEVFNGMYIAIAALVRDGADTLTVTHTRVLSSKDGVVRTLFDIGRSEQEWQAHKDAGRKGWTSFREALNLILQHDERVREHLELIEETPEAATYRIVPDLPDK
jgi:hypothetical protein